MMFSVVNVSMIRLFMLVFFRVCCFVFFLCSWVLLVKVREDFGVWWIWMVY